MTAHRTTDYRRWFRRVWRTVLTISLCFTAVVAFGESSDAEWTVSGESRVFYTDDAALFSATRRFIRHQDPTQPTIDRELGEQGDDVVFEPAAQIVNTWGSPGRQTEIAVRGQGFIFAENARFNHGALGVQLRQGLSPTTDVALRYFFGPDLLLGDNEVREAGGAPPQIAQENVTTHYWAAGLEQRVHDEVTAIVLLRYGLRRYNKAFAQRDTDFWTVGTHVEWEVNDRVNVAVGYHYERGLADGRKQPELRDDLSYVNHFATAELDLALTDRVVLELAFHYERNNWTTGIIDDPRRHQHDETVQGDITVVYHLTHEMNVAIGFQGAHRQESFEEGLHVYNGWVGGEVTF